MGPDQVHGAAGAPRRPWTLAQLARAIIVLAGLPCLVLVVAAIVSMVRDKTRDIIVFDNRLSAEVEVVVDGEKVDTIPPRSEFWIHPAVKLPPGAKHLEVRAKGEVVSAVELAIRPRREGEHGYRGLYVIGRSRDYAIAKVPYAPDGTEQHATPTLVRLPRPAPLTELPRELASFEMKSIDGVFPKSQSMPKGAKLVWKTQLCTVDWSEDPPAIGCSGFPEEGYELE